MELRGQYIYLNWPVAEISILSPGCPDSIESLAEIPGIGERKLKLYGEDLIRITAQYPHEAPADNPGGEAAAYAKADP